MTQRFTNRTVTRYEAARFALLAGLMALAPVLASAQSRCPVLNGTYAFAFSGTAIFPGSTAPTAYNGIGFQTFDGAGKFTATESGNFNGLVLRSVTFSGTYTLNADCTGSMAGKLPDGSTGHQDFVVADGGKTIYAIGTDNMGPGGTLSTTFTKMPLIW